MFQLNTRYTFTMPEGTISESGARVISKYLDSQRLTNEDWKALNPDSGKVYLPYLPDDWQWSWVITGKGEYVGTFPKRLSKYFWQEHGLKCPQSFLQQIGNLARQHSSEQVTYTFDFTNQIDWQDGEFGDYGSCYWGDRSAARTMLEENGALAIRFYSGDSGIGRAWVAQLADKQFIVFNGYGIQGNATMKIAQIMATWLGLNYKKIDLSNHGETSGTLYINGDLGYLIGTAEQTAMLESYDLEFYCSECLSCYRCDDGLNDDNSYHAPDGESYCQNCFYDRFDYCAICDDCDYREDMVYIEDKGDICSTCLDRHYRYCEECNEYYSIMTMTRIENVWYCKDCKPKEESEE